MAVPQLSLCMFVISSGLKLAIVQIIIIGWRMWVGRLAGPAKVWTIKCFCERVEVAALHRMPHYTFSYHNLNNQIVILEL